MVQYGDNGKLVKKTIAFALACGNAIVSDNEEDVITVARDILRRVPEDGNSPHNMVVLGSPKTSERVFTYLKHTLNVYGRGTKKLERIMMARLGFHLGNNPVDDRNVIYEVVRHIAANKCYSVVIFAEDHEILVLHPLAKLIQQKFGTLTRVYFVPLREE